MNGMILKSDTKQDRGLYKIIPDSGGLLKNWICDGLGETSDWVGENYTIGILYDNKLIGGLIFNNYRVNVDIWLTIYTLNPKWCSRSVLRYIFTTCFETLKCKRVGVLVSKDNSKSLSLCQRLGFKIEGLLRQYRENGTDCYILGMLKEENKWS